MSGYKSDCNIRQSSGPAVTLDLASENHEEAWSEVNQTLGVHGNESAIGDLANASHEIAFGNYGVQQVDNGNRCRPGSWHRLTSITLSKPVIPKEKKRYHAACPSVAPRVSRGEVGTIRGSIVRVFYETADARERAISIPQIPYRGAVRYTVIAAAMIRKAPMRKSGNSASNS